MSSEAPPLLVGVVIILVAGLIFLGFIGSYRITALQNEAIELGYAQHNAKTGDWEWIKKP